MKLALVIPHFTSYRVFLAGLAQHLVERGSQVRVFTDCGGHSGAEDRGVGVHNLPIPRGASPLGQLRAACQLRDALAKERPEVLHAHFSSAILTCAFAGIRRHAGFSWCTFQGLGYPLRGGAMGRLLRYIEPRAAGKFGRIEVLTDDDQRSLSTLLPRRKIVRQPGYGFGCEDRFIDTPLPNPSERARLRAAFLPGKTGPVFLFMGRLVRFKGFDLAVRAFWEFRMRHGSATLVVVGERDGLHGSGLSEREWEDLRADRDIYLAGWQNDPLPWLDCADGMIFLSKREGVPVSVMEAISRQVPVLGFDARGTRDLLADGSVGLLAKSDDLEETLRLMRALVVPSRPWNFAVREQLRRSRWISYTREVYTHSVRSRDIRPCT